MARKFSELRDKMTPEARARSDRMKEQLIAAMPLHELRRARKLTQEQIASSLHLDQPAVSKLERRTDMFISTLRNFVRAMGGDLEISANFPDGRIVVTGIAEIGDDEDENDNDDANNERELAGAL